MNPVVDSVSYSDETTKRDGMMILIYQHTQRIDSYSMAGKYDNTKNTTYTRAQMYEPWETWTNVEKHRDGHQGQPNELWILWIQTRET